MKRLGFPLTMILCSWTATLMAAGIDFGDLKYYETANPYTDLESSTAKGDLRFIALAGAGIYIPGVEDYYDKYLSYDYKLIKGTSDSISNYEHGRLIHIARYYATAYNQALLRHIESVKARTMAENTNGYENAKRVFEFGHIMIGNINMLPYSLHADLTLNKPNCVHQARWFDPIINGKPAYDWNQLLEIFGKIDLAVCQHGWIKEWIESGANRTAEAQVFGVRPYAEPNFHDFVEVPWDKADIDGRPYYEILLRENRKWVATLYISDDNDTAMITNLNGAGGNHWLDEKILSYHPSAPRVMVIDKSGHWRIAE